MIRTTLIGTLITLFSSCSVTADFKAHQKFVKDVLLDTSAFPPEILYTDGVPLRYVQAGNAKEGVVVWVHGTPGAWTEAGKLFVDQDLLARVKLVSLDRPGWGASKESDAKRSNYVSFEDQNRYISPLLHKLKAEHPDTPLFIAGHSWGASLAPYLAAKNIELIAGMALFAGTFSENYAKPRWYHRVGETWIGRAVVGSGLLKANSEMFSLPRGLAEMSHQWQSLKDIPILVVQGAKDYLVKPKNVEYIRDILPSDQLHVVLDESYGHMWHIQRNSQVSACLVALVTSELGRCDDAILRNPEAVALN